MIAVTAAMIETTVPVINEVRELWGVMGGIRVTTSGFGVNLSGVWAFAARGRPAAGGNVPANHRQGQENPASSTPGFDAQFQWIDTPPGRRSDPPNFR